MVFRKKSLASLETRSNHYVTIGELLYQARIKENLSLDDMSKTTRIRYDYLMAMEQGNFAALPEGVVMRAHLKNYAHTLGLDSYELLDMLDKELGLIITEQKKTIDHAAYHTLFSPNIPLVCFTLCIAFIVCQVWVILERPFIPASPERETLLLDLYSNPNSIIRIEALQPVGVVVATQDKGMEGSDNLTTLWKGILQPQESYIIPHDVNAILFASNFTNLNYYIDNQKIASVETMPNIGKRGILLHRDKLLAHVILPE